MQELIRECWSTDEKERPTFGEIFERLSKDFSYLDEVDPKEVNDYLKVLEKQRQNFFAFNEVPSSLSDMIFDTSNGKQGTYFEAICPPLKGKNETSCTLKIYEKKPSIEGQKSLLESIECQSILLHGSIQSLIGFSLPTEKDDHYKVVTPLYVNGSLSDLISAVAKGNVPTNWETIKAISIFGIAAGMAFIHQNRIILGDLCPESVFFDQDFHPKIGEFANAVSIKNGKKRDVPHKLLEAFNVYKAPELLKESSYSTKIDVYAFSILLVKLLTLSNPYPAKTKEELIAILDKVKHENYRPNIKESNWYKNQEQNERRGCWAYLMENCWSEYPSERPSFIDIVQRFIEKKDIYFNMDLIDKDEFNNYIDLVTSSFYFD